MNVVARSREKYSGQGRFHKEDAAQDIFNRSEEMVFLKEAL